MRVRCSAERFRDITRAVSSRWGILLLLCALGCRRKSDEEVGASKAAVPDQVNVVLGERALAAAKLAFAQPTRAPRRESVVAAGTIEFTPSRVARIGPSVAGRVSSVPVAPGQAVARGTVVATLESVELGRAQAELVIAKSNSDVAAAELDRERRLLGSGASSERAVAMAEANQRTAGAEVRAAQARIATLGSGSRNGSVSLSTPLAGTVLELRARVGQPVGPTDTLVVVGETTEVWLTVLLYERDLGKVHQGDPVRATTLAYPGRVFLGAVDQVGAMVDEVRHVLEARIVLKNEDGALKPGMTATARIVGAVVAGDGGAEDVLTVPSLAVQSIEGQPYVFVQHGPGEFELRAVMLGSEFENDTEILRGLQGSETVVTDGSFLVKSELLREQMGSND